MKTQRWYDAIFWAGLLLFIAENIYFGWNSTPQSSAERALDFVTSCAMLYGIVGSVATSAARSVYEEMLEEEEDEADDTVEPTI